MDDLRSRLPSLSTKQLEKAIDEAGGDLDLAVQQVGGHGPSGYKDML